MDARQAARNLEVIRTLMERTCQYQLLTARAGLAAGCLAGIGALLLLVLQAEDPWQFGLVWLGVFVGSILAVIITTILRSRERGEMVWSRPARTVVVALLPALFAALVLTVFFFLQGMHMWLPGIWMLCYGLGALATAAYAPATIRWLGIAVLVLSGPTLWLGPAWAILMMGLVFGLGHIVLGVVLLWIERRQVSFRLHRSVA
jgi:hypothetical protein